MASVGDTTSTGVGEGVDAARGADDMDATPLPSLRPELRIMEAAEDAGWSDGHLIFDPLRNAYFRVPRLAARALACWRSGSVGGVRACLRERHGIEARVEDVLDLALFLESNGLVEPGPGGWSRLLAAKRRAHRGIFSRILHGYLFFRVPLVRPQRFLEAAFPHVRWMGSRAGLLALVAIFLLGAWLTLRQWEQFQATFMGFVNMQGLLLFGLTIVITKVAHELGHAFLALRHGCRVPTMGVAFMVMMPMFYTDVTDAWKLRDARARMLIGAGGMIVELALAGVALFLWGVLEEGPARTAAFFVATTSLLTTLLVNASPFMRFDGYHILADMLRMHNLQPRAFALGTWWLRRVLLGLKDPPPEEFSPRLRRWLIIYAFATWIYRLLLFLGIALLVYHAFPKVVGIFLAAVEIWWFILRPVWAEVRRMWELREEVMTRGRPRRVALVALAALALLFAPIWGSVRLPAVMMADAEQEVHAPEPARIAAFEVSPGQRVRAGTLLLRLESEALEQELRQTGARLALVEHRLARMAASTTDLAVIDVLREERRQLRAALDGLRKRRKRLELRARVDGVVRFVGQGMMPGRWVNEDELLLRIVSPDARHVAALAPETAVGRLRAGAAGVFVPDDPGLPAMQVRLREIGVARRQGRDIVYLASVHGGPVEARRDPDDGTVRTRTGMFPVRLISADGEAGAAPCAHACRGVVKVEAARESLAGRFFRRVVAVVLRESGF